MKSLDQVRALFGTPPESVITDQKQPQTDSGAPSGKVAPSLDTRAGDAYYEDARASSWNHSYFKGCVVVFTGKAERIRADLLAIAVNAGAKVEKRVNVWTTYLVAASPNGSSTKLSKARSCGIDIISVGEFYEMVIHGR